ncbi:MULTISPECIES: type IV secretion protein Rhs [unclassified Acinetobacter]|uniref:type IV secretion protein Rhs n=1 Tax=unclassified Acinetobacter TaxID=196816 RepID=UPI0035BB7871
MSFFKDFAQYSRELIMPKRRKLTVGEKEMARQIFMDALDMENVEVVAHRLVLKDYAMSPNGRIYFHPKDYVDDFSQQDLSTQSWLIHELAHIWQMQQGVKVVRKALLDRRYRYVLELGKGFAEYGVEQQAQMIQDYFLRKQRGQDCGLYENCIPFLQDRDVNTPTQLT